MAETLTDSLSGKTDTTGLTTLISITKDSFVVGLAPADDNAPTGEVVGYRWENPDTTIWEQGAGEFIQGAGATPSTIARTTVYNNSDGTTAPITMPSGTKNVFLVPSAQGINDIAGSATYFEVSEPQTAEAGDLWLDEDFD